MLPSTLNSTNAPLTCIQPTDWSPDAPVVLRMRAPPPTRPLSASIQGVPVDTSTVGLAVVPPGVTGVATVAGAVLAEALASGASVFAPPQAASSRLASATGAKGAGHRRMA